MTVKLIKYSFEDAIVSVMLINEIKMITDMSIKKEKMSHF
jgi:hypothetical protein